MPSPPHLVVSRNGSHSALSREGCSPHSRPSSSSTWWLWVEGWHDRIWCVAFRIWRPRVLTAQRNMVKGSKQAQKIPENKIKNTYPRVCKISNPLPVPALYPWETSTGTTRTRYPQVFPRVLPWVPTGYPYSWYALSCFECNCVVVDTFTERLVAQQ